MDEERECALAIFRRMVMIGPPRLAVVFDPARVRVRVAVSAVVRLDGRISRYARSLLRSIDGDDHQGVALAIAPDGELGGSHAASISGCGGQALGGVPSYGR